MWIQAVAIALPRVQRHFECEFQSLEAWLRPSQGAVYRCPHSLPAHIVLYCLLIHDTDAIA